jgi:hypothetical protein
MATLATGTATTVTAIVAERPSLVAVIVALPAPTAVTTPALETCAMLLFDVVQLLERPASSRPDASRTVAVIATV